MPTTIIRAAAADHSREPIRFSIPVPTVGGGEELELFEVQRPVPVMAVLDAAVVETETAPYSEQRIIAQGRLLRSFLRSDYPRFVKAADAAGFGYDELGQIINLVLTGSTGRPTAPSSGSESSPSDSGSSSTDGAGPSGDATPPPYPPTS